MRHILLLLLTISLWSTPLHAEDPIEKSQIDEIERFYRYAAKSKDRNEQVRFMRHCIPLYEKFLWQYKKGPYAAMARFHLGHAQQTLGQLHNAKRSYSLVITTHKKGYWVGSAARQLAYLSLQKKEYKTAARYFGITAANIDDATIRQNALTKQAQSLMEIGAAKEALGAFEQIASDRAHPFREWGIFMKGYVYFEDERFQEASEALRPLIEETATESYRTQALFYTGLCAAELGNGELAEQNLRAVLDTPHRTPSLTDDERRRIARNKSLAQNSLMGMYFKQKEYEEVVKLYRLGDFGARGKLEARRSLRAGKSFYYLKRYDQARTAFRRVDRSVPNTTLAFDASFKCLECDYQLKHPGLPQRVDVFLELYAKQNWNDPKIQKSLFLKAQTLYNNGSMEEAAKAFNRIRLKNLPEEFHQEMLFKRGFVLAETGDFNGATRNLNFYLRDFPDHSHVLEAKALRGKAYESLGDRTSALNDFESLLKDEDCPPHLYSVALQNSARLFRSEKKFEPMIKNYRSLLDRFKKLPRDTIANANYWIGWGYYKLGEHEDAIPYLKKSMALTPDAHAEAAGKILVLIYFASSNAKSMDEELRKLLILKPKKIIPKHMLTWLGARMFHDGNFSSAARYLGRATHPEKVKEKDKAIWRMLAKAQNATKQYDKALISTKIALAIEKDKRWIADTHLDVAAAHLGLGQNALAQKAAIDGLAFQVRGPHNAGLHLTLGEVAYIQEDYERAYEEAITTIRITVDDPFVKPRGLYLAAEAAEKLGSNEESARYRRQLKQSYPDWVPKLDLTKATTAKPDPTAPETTSRETTSPEAVNRATPVNANE